MSAPRISPGTEYTQALAKAGLRHAEEISARLAKPEWKPSRAQIEQARNSIKKLSELLLTPAQSGVMRSADKALETVASWSSSKQAYAARVTGAGVAQTVGWQSVAAALARRLCQLFDSGGESQRSVRARHASALFQLLNSEAPEFLAEQAKCDKDPVGYLEASERCSDSSTLHSDPPETATGLNKKFPYNVEGYEL